MVPQVTEQGKNKVKIFIYKDNAITNDLQQKKSLPKKTDIALENNDMVKDLRSQIYHAPTRNLELCKRY